MQFLPDGTVKIQNNKTKAVKIVKPEELPNYGIPYTKYQQEYNAYNEMQGGAPDVARKAEALDKLKTEQGAEGAKRVLDIMNKRASNELSGDQYNSMLLGAVSDFNSKKAFGEGGKSLTPAEKAMLSGQLVNLVDVNPALTDKIGGFVTGKTPAVRSELGEDEEKIRQKMINAILKANPNADISAYQAPAKGETGFKQDVNDIISGLATGGVNFAKLVGEGAVSTKRLGANALYHLTGGRVGEDITGNEKPVFFTPEEQANFNPVQGAGDMAGGVVNEYNELLGRPTEGGDVLGRIGTHATEHPVDTVMDILPVLPAIKNLGTASKASKASKAVKAVETTSKAEGVLPKIAKTTQDVVEGGNELMTGGGTKELIAKNVMLDEAESLNKTLLKHNIYSSPTLKGKIEATQKALVDEGSSLAKRYTKSKAVVNSSDLNAKIDALKLKYGGIPEADNAFNQAKTAILGSGKYDITTGNSKLTMTDLWNMKKYGEEFGPKAFNMSNGPLIKDMAKDITKVLREELDLNVPEAVSDLRTYGNLRTYMDDILTDPQGANIQSRSGLFSFLGNAASTGGQFLGQKVYNMAERGLPSITEQYTPLANKVSNPTVLPPITPQIPYIQPAGGVIQNEPRQILRDMRYKQGNFQPKN